MQQEEETSGFGAVSAGSPVTQVAGIGQNLPLLEAYPAFRLLTTSRGVTNPGFCAKIGVEDKEGRGLLRGVSPRGTLKRGVKRLSRIRETRTRLHVHARTHTRARASRHRYEEGGGGKGAEETSKWRVQFLARIEHEGFIGWAAEFSWNLAVKKIGYPASRNLWWSRILIRVEHGRINKCIRRFLDCCCYLPTKFLNIAFTVSSEYRLFFGDLCW